MVVRIRDYGPGIPEEELPFVKQKFYKGSSKARGSGIGLAVCDEIVTAPRRHVRHRQRRRRRRLRRHHPPAHLRPGAVKIERLLHFCERV